MGYITLFVNFRFCTRHALLSFFILWEIIADICFQCAEKLESSESTKATIYTSLAQTHKDLQQYDEAKRWLLKELEAREGNATEVNSQVQVLNNYSEDSQLLVSLGNLP